MKPIMKVRGLKHVFVSEARSFALHIPEFNLPKGAMTAIIGPSGCGKTTFMSRLGLILQSELHPSEFRIYHSEQGENYFYDVAEILREESSRARRAVDSIRRSEMGFFLQNSALIETLTILENVTMPLRLAGHSSRNANRRATDLIGELLGNSRSGDKLPNQLSGGERQRIAIARAIIHEPSILFMDEPTSSLDPELKREVMAMVSKLAMERDTAIFLISHDVAMAAEFADHMVTMGPQPSGWGELFPMKFGRSDTFVQPTRFQTKIDSLWLDCDAKFTVSDELNHEVESDQQFALLD